MKTGDVVDRVNRVAISFLSVICLFHVVDFASRFLLGTQTFFLVDDDPLISLRIANNIAHGLGPYFNAGEHVAANTSLSWPFLVAPVFHFTALPEAVLVLSIISVLLTAITFALIAFSATSTRSAVLSLATLLLLPGFTIMRRVPGNTFRNLFSQPRHCLFCSAGQNGWQTIPCRYLLSCWTSRFSCGQTRCRSWWCLDL